MEIIIPKAARIVLNTLSQNGFSAYVVGGCVRDFLLHQTPLDWDICTSATPSEVKQLFQKTFDTGLKHGTVSVLLNGEIFEVTTFRCDGAYIDGRRPESVTFTTSLKADLSRRDFTINAMAYNEQTGLVDPFGGINDLNRNCIRCVGDPDVRFKEDALRMLRAVRFSAQKNFEIEKQTFLSIKKNAALVQKLSAERVIEEITKILLSDHVEKIKTLYTLGLLPFIMPELCRCFETQQHIKWHIYDVGTHSLKAAEYVEKKPYLLYSALLHDWGKPETKGKNADGSDSFRNHAKYSVVLAEAFLKRYKFSNLDKSRILRLVKYHDREILPEKKYIKRAINDVGDDIFLDLINLKRADCKAQNFTLTAPRLKYFDDIERLYHQIKTDQESFCIKDLAVNGHDLIQMGLRGKEIGRALFYLQEHVIDVPSDNQKEKLLQLLNDHGRF